MIQKRFSYCRVNKDSAVHLMPITESDYHEYMEDENLVMDTFEITDSGMDVVCYEPSSKFDWLFRIEFVWVDETNDYSLSNATFSSNAGPELEI